SFFHLQSCGHLHGHMMPQLSRTATTLPVRGLLDAGIRGGRAPRSGWPAAAAVVSSAAVIDLGEAARSPTERHADADDRVQEFGLHQYPRKQASERSMLRSYRSALRVSPRDHFVADLLRVI